MNKKDKQIKYDTKGRRLGKKREIHFESNTACNVSKCHKQVNFTLFTALMRQRQKYSDKDKDKARDKDKN